MRSAAHAEWTKLRTSPGAMALLCAVIAGTVGVGAIAAGCTGPGCGADLPRLSLTGVHLGQALVAILAVQAMGNEYSTLMIGVTLAAVPRRGRVLVAKAGLVAGAVAAAASVAVALSLVVGHAMLPAHELVLRPAIGSVLYLVLVGLLSLGVATALRNPAVAIGVVLALLYALPIVITAVTDPVWHKRLQQINPTSAGLSVQATVGDAVIGPWSGLGVLALWALGALLVGAVVLHRRDA